MLATLVIALPSEHRGGDVIVQLRDKEQTLKTQGLCDFGFSYLAWYADVDHSVSKVESGYRLVLTYNLIRQASDSNCMASVLDDHKQNLDNVLSYWSENEHEMDFDCRKLMYVLEDDYPDTNICLDQLTGKDRPRMRYLLDACQDQGFCLFFAHAECSQSGTIEEEEDDYNWGDPTSGADFHEFIDKLEPEWRLMTVYRHDGKAIAEDVRLEEEELLEIPDFTEVEPDDEEMDGCSGMHFYRKTCAVVLRRTRRFDLLSAAKKINVKAYVNTLLKEMEDERLSTSSREELYRFCEMVIARSKRHNPREACEYDSYNFSPREDESELEYTSCVADKELVLIAKIILKLDRPHLLEKLAKVISQTKLLDLFRELGEGLVGRDMSVWLKG